MILFFPRNSFPIFSILFSVKRNSSYVFCHSSPLSMNWHLYLKKSNFNLVNFTILSKFFAFEIKISIWLLKSSHKLDNSLIFGSINSRIKWTWVEPLFFSFFSISKSFTKIFLNSFNLHLYPWVNTAISFSDKLGFSFINALAIFIISEYFSHR